MTKSLIPYGEFQEFGETVEYTRIIVWRSKVVEQVTNECDTKNDRLIVMKPFTTDVVIGWLLEKVIHESALTTYYAYICSDHGYKITEVVIPFTHSELTKEYITQIIKIFKKLKRYRFSWGSPHVKNLYIRGSKVVLVNHSKSTITVDGVKYAGQQSYLHCPLNNPSRKINLMRIGHGNELSFRVLDVESFKIVKTLNDDSFGLQYDFYSLMISLMTWKVFRDNINIDTIWKGMWKKSEFDHIARLIQDHVEPPPEEVIDCILTKFTLSTAVIENVSRLI
uniref:Protein kinase n=1 Tax=Pithovirus LCPAC401 TaxID=2506595 RepID=A0A481ZBU5_9VIRU|nr:MAG: hypothetical protein LCPAC401_02480 [Pithovirus LCPAC401]